MYFGEYLVKEKVVSIGSVNQALELQRRTTKAIDRRYRRIGNILLLICAIDEGTLVRYYAKFLKTNEQYISTMRFTNDEVKARLLTLEEQEQLESVILSIDNEKRQIIIGTISNSESNHTRVRVLINKLKPGYTIVIRRIFEVPYKLWLKSSYYYNNKEYNPIELKVSVDEKMKTVFRYAVENNATDISIESQERETFIYLTIDKERQQYYNIRFTPNEAEEITNWIITKSGIGQTHAVQPVVDCALPSLGDIFTHRARVNKISTYHGVTINMRILPNKPMFIDLKSLNYSNFIYKYLEFLTKPRKGLVLVVGPTNSGKNTSVFAVITSLLKNYKLKVISLEHPVEYLVPGVQQINATTDKDYTETARALVRQSPDVIYLSEIRDHITMDTALNVSNTGKFVLSTLHVSNAYDVFNRAEDVYGSDVSAKLLSELIGVVNQVLLPQACPTCLYEKKISDLDPMYRKVLTDHKYRGLIYDNTGRTKDGNLCPTCNGNGYKGIIPVAEYINFDEALKRKLRVIRTNGEREELLIDQMKRNNNSLLYDALRNMASKKVSISTLINKSILDSGFEMREEN